MSPRWARTVAIYNCGMHNFEGAVATLRRRLLHWARGLDRPMASPNTEGNAMLDAIGVTALAENGSENNYAMGNYNVATATLHGGVFTARGGTNNYALTNELTVTMKAENVTALAENGTS